MTERKLICGVWHIKTPCLRCKGMIWVAGLTFDHGIPLCTDCNPNSVSGRVFSGNPHPPKPISQTVYDDGDRRWANEDN